MFTGTQTHQGSCIMDATEWTRDAPSTTLQEHCEYHQEPLVSRSSTLVHSSRPRYFLTLLPLLPLCIDYTLIRGIGGRSSPALASPFDSALGTGGREYAPSPHLFIIKFRVYRWGSSEHRVHVGLNFYLERFAHVYQAGGVLRGLAIRSRDFQSFTLPTPMPTHYRNI